MTIIDQINFLSDKLDIKYKEDYNTFKIFYQNGTFTSFGKKRHSQEDVLNYLIKSIGWLYGGLKI